MPGMHSTAREMARHGDLIIGVLIYAVFGLGLAVTIRLEFGDAFLSFCIQHYPHMVLYPALFGWVLVLSITAMVRAVKGKVRRRRFAMIWSASFAGAVLALLISEVNRPPFMVFEASDSATARKRFEQEKEKGNDLAQRITGLEVNASKNRNYATERQGLLTQQEERQHSALLDFDPANVNGKYGGSSFSRWLYYGSFVVLVTIVVSGLLSIVHIPPAGQAASRELYLKGLVGTFLAFMPWVAMRFYFDQVIIDPIFGGGSGSRGAIVMATITVFLLFLAAAIFRITKSLIEVALAVGTATLTGLSYLKPEYVPVVFGFESGLGVWFLWTMLLAIVVYLTANIEDAGDCIID